MGYMFHRKIYSVMLMTIPTMGDDNISSEDFIESQINQPGEERYWDDPDGKES